MEKEKDNESDLAYLAREIWEEHDVQLVESVLQFFDQSEVQADGHKESIVVSMRCYFADCEGSPQASSEIESFEWIR